MKILIVTPKYYPDNFPITLVAERLVKEGHEVDVLTSLPFKEGNYIKGYNEGLTKENGVNIFRVKTTIRKESTSSLIRNYLSLHKIFKRWAKKCHKEYDLVYSYSISPVISLVAGNIYSKKHHVPHIVYVLDVWPESVVAVGRTTNHSLLYKCLLSWSKKEYQGASKIIIGSKDFKEYLTDIIKLDNVSIEYLPQPGLVFEDKDSKNPYDSKKTNLLYCGNISKLQLVDYFIPANERLNNNNVVLNIVGNGSYLSEFKNELASKNLDNIIYHGSFDYKESSKYFRYSDAIVVSLKNKGIVGKTLPNKLISSLYYAKPIIGLVDGEAKEVLVKNGNIVSLQSIDGLVDSINKFLELSKEDIKAIENKNRQYYDDYYSIDKFIEKLLSSFSSK